MASPRLPRYRRPHIPNFRKVTRSLSRIANRMSEEAIREFAEGRVVAFQTRIRAQDFAAFRDFPLSEKYLRRKVLAGADTRTMIARGHYMDSIRVFRRRNEDGTTTFHIGFHARTLARDLDGNIVPFPLYRVAEVQEHGSEEAQIPPRPHWRPELQRIAQAARPFRRRLAENIVKEVRRDLKKRLVA